MRVYLITLPVGGELICGGSGVPVATGIEPTGDVATDIEAALDALFIMKSRYYGSLYNPASFSILRVSSVEFDESAGLATVWLSGKYKLSGNDCDHSRVRSQIWSTIYQFREVGSTDIYINGPHPFGDFVSDDR